MFDKEFHGWRTTSSWQEGRYRIRCSAAGTDGRAAYWVCTSSRLVSKCNHVSWDWTVTARRLVANVAYDGRRQPEIGLPRNPGKANNASPLFASCSRFRSHSIQSSLISSRSQIKNGRAGSYEWEASVPTLKPLPFTNQIGIRQVNI